MCSLLNYKDNSKYMCYKNANHAENSQTGSRKHKLTTYCRTSQGLSKCQQYSE